MTLHLTIVDEMTADHVKDRICINEETDGLAFYCIDHAFYVDDIRYDQAEATNECRPMFEIRDDDDPDYAVPPAHWSPVPVTEAEMRVFLHSGVLDGRYLG